MSAFRASVRPGQRRDAEQRGSEPRLATSRSRANEPSEVCHTSVRSCEGGWSGGDELCDDGEIPRGREPSAGAHRAGVSEPTPGVGRGPHDSAAERWCGRLGADPGSVGGAGRGRHDRGHHDHEPARAGCRRGSPHPPARRGRARSISTSPAKKPSRPTRLRVLTCPGTPGWRNGRRRRLKPAGSVMERESSNLSPGTRRHRTRRGGAGGAAWAATQTRQPPNERDNQASAAPKRYTTTPAIPRCAPNAKSKGRCEPSEVTGHLGERQVRCLGRRVDLIRPCEPNGRQD